MVQGADQHVNVNALVSVVLVLGARFGDIAAAVMNGDKRPRIIKDGRARRARHSVSEVLYPGGIRVGYEIVGETNVLRATARVLYNVHPIVRSDGCMAQRNKTPSVCGIALDTNRAPVVSFARKEEVCWC